MPGTEDAEMNQRPPALERLGQHRQVKQVGHGTAVTIHVYQVLGSQQSATSWEEGRREKARSDLTNEILDSVCLLFPGIVPKRFSPWEKRRYCEEGNYRQGQRCKQEQNI